MISYYCRCGDSKRGKMSYVADAPMPVPFDVPINMPLGIPSGSPQSTETASIDISILHHTFCMYTVSESKCIGNKVLPCCFTVSNIKASLQRHDYAGRKASQAFCVSE